MFRILQILNFHPWNKPSMFNLAVMFITSPPLTIGLELFLEFSFTKSMCFCIAIYLKLGFCGNLKLQLTYRDLGACLL